MNGNEHLERLHEAMQRLEEAEGQLAKQFGTLELRQLTLHATLRDLKQSQSFMVLLMCVLVVVGVFGAVLYAQALAKIDRLEQQVALYAPLTAPEEESLNEQALQSILPEPDIQMPAGDGAASDEAPPDTQPGELTARDSLVLRAQSPD